MKTSLFLLIALMPACALADESAKLNVLFIGNSMTWFNNMPRIVSELA